ncbi:acyl-CoA thioesterase [Sporosarcina sp. PTS2304]|uniref:acyl-CoA thioesterase n=1 Tax=Sporosarcina sp. PTS2304 TaxID=2283194 RepID=UPI000E0DB088|nr:thioesterase family protein [Sporosarcina sp. PTS2304]AXH99163.1 acyl-CoA thioesterase [Sporosarcina sp. PTS2304]
MFSSEKQIEVRYAETDQMGVVYHANYLIWMEIGRTTLIQDLGFHYAQLEKDGYLSPVTEVSVKYKTSITYGETITVRTWVQSHGKLRTTYGYEILHADGTIAATAVSEHVIVKRDSFRPVSLRKIHPQWDATYTEIQRGED